MKKYIKANTDANTITLADVLAQVPAVDDINIQNSEGSIYSGLCQDFRATSDYYVDPAGNDFTKDELLGYPVSLIRPYKNILIVAIDT